MPIASSQYWNSIHGRGPGEAVGDAEGSSDDAGSCEKYDISMKSIELGKEEVWSSGEGRGRADTFYQIEKNDIGRKLCDESAETGKSDQKGMCLIMSRKRRIRL